MQNLFNFLIIGVLNTLFYYLLYSLFTYIGLHYSSAVFVATLIGMLFSFKTFGKYVFKNSNNRLIFRFLFFATLNYLLNIAIIYILKEGGYSNYTAGAISCLIVAVSSFLVNKFFVFK